MRLKRFLVATIIALAFLALSGIALAADADPVAAPATGDADTQEVSGAFDMERCVKRALQYNPSMTAIRSQLQGSKSWHPVFSG